MANKLQQLLGIDVPIIQAPMAGVQDWRLAAAVSEAGGLGSIPCGMLDVAQVVSAIENSCAASSKPYNLNFFCHAMPEPNEPELKRWLQELKPYYTEYGIDQPSDLGALRLPFSQAVLDAIKPYRPPVISFHFGLPSQALLVQIKAWGAMVLSSATTIEEALWLEANGADIVIAQGIEAGGHRGNFLSSDLSTQLPTEALVNALNEQIALPIIAAGGIASRGDTEAMLQAGASAVQVGTSYLLCTEATTSEVHRKALQGEGETTITNVFSGRPARGITNRLIKEQGEMSPYAPVFPYATAGSAPLRKAAEAKGLADFTPLWSGTNRSGFKPVSAADITRELSGR